MNDAAVTVLIMIYLESISVRDHDRTLEKVGRAGGIGSEVSSVVAIITWEASSIHKRNETL